MSGKKVNLFLVGAMKAGTTSFSELISAHPTIYLPPIKEPHYFVPELPEFIYSPSRFFDIKNYFENDFPKPLHIANLKKPEHYEQLYSMSGNAKYRLDASTSYLACPGTSERIKQYNPEAMIIILVRNPFERMFSHYKMQKGLSREIRPFNQVVNTEIESYRQGSLAWNSYLEMSLYKKQVDSFKKSFRNVLVLEFEKFVKNPGETLKDVEDFLDVEPFEQAHMKRTNMSRKLRFEKLFFLLRKIGLKDVFSKLFGRSFKQWVFRNISTRYNGMPEIDADAQEELNRIFKEASLEC